MPIGASKASAYLKPYLTNECGNGFLAASLNSRKFRLLLRRCDFSWWIIVLAQVDIVNRLAIDS